LISHQPFLRLWDAQSSDYLIGIDDVRMTWVTNVRSAEAGDHDGHGKLLRVELSHVVNPCVIITFSPVTASSDLDQGNFRAII
jgi:hypothetical protein